MDSRRRHAVQRHFAANAGCSVRRLPAVCIPFSIRVIRHGNLSGSNRTSRCGDHAHGRRRRRAVRQDQKPDLLPQGHLRNRRFSQSKGSRSGTRLRFRPAQASRHDPRRSGWPRGLHSGEDTLQRQSCRLWRKRLEKDARVLRQYDLAVRGAKKLTGHL